MISLNNFAIVLCTLLTAATSLHYNIFKKDVTMLDVLCSHKAALNFDGVRTAQECGSMCHTNAAHCRGFFYSKNRKQCKGVSTILSSNAICENKTGYSYYKENVLRSRFGDVCTTDDQCVMAAGKCINGTCSCVAGYSHDPSTGSCVSECDLYGSTFTKYEKSYMAQLLINPIVNVTLAYCKELCSNSTVCRGFNHLAVKDQCKQLEVTPLTEPDSYRRSTSIDYYNRDCAL